MAAGYGNGYAQRVRVTVSRNIIERAFSHLKDWRRVATRYDNLATVVLASILLWWI